jgi:hypothetical protein
VEEVARGAEGVGERGRGSGRGGRVVEERGEEADTAREVSAESAQGPPRLRERGDLGGHRRGGHGAADEARFPFGERKVNANAMADYATRLVAAYFLSRQAAPLVICTIRFRSKGSDPFARSKLSFRATQWKRTFLFPTMVMSSSFHANTYWLEEMK